MTGRIAGRTALITGTGGGQGREAALRFAAEGARVVGCDVKVEGAAETLAMVQAAGGEMVSQAPVDLTDEDAVRSWIDFAVDAYGDFDILYNNASAIRSGTIDVLTREDFDWTMQNEVTLVFLAIKHALPVFQRKGGGAIVNIASVAGLGGGAGGVAYTAAKHGVIGLTKSTAFLYGPKLVRCNAVCPGGVATPIIQTSAFAKVPWAGERLAASFARVDRVAEPEDIAELVAFLGSDSAANINGAVITSDGGWMAA
jgi:meso-butanediol dehydrogenase / (S,S)-butanediol dehydrogenase / diacetyl reductase